MSFQIGFCCLCIFFLFSFVLLLSLVVGACSSSPCKIRSITNWEQINNNKWLRMKKILYFVWSPPWHLYILLLANLLAFYLTFYLAFYLTFYLAFYLAYLLAFYLAYLLAFYLTFYLAYLLAFYLTFHLHIFWHSIWPLRSSGAHWAGQVPGWGPAVHTELGRSPVEVQRCTLSWAGPRLRSSSAHWAGKLAKSLAQRVGEESWQRAGRRVGKAEVHVEVDADMVEEKLEEEDEEEEDS